MPSFLRRGLTCFYCGQKSSQKRAGSIRQWRCESCDAVNHLDENGQITDPPASDTPSRPQSYATLAPRSISPEITTTSEPHFCSTCIKNQHLYTQALSEYLPDPSDPNYAKYESSYPEFKANLEKRYPQVCATCAPIVNDQLRRATYAAQTDHLRRLMDKTKRGTVVDKGAWGWRDFLVLLGGLAWWSSFLGQLAWHTLGYTLAASADPESLNTGSCIRETILFRTTSMACFANLAPIARWILILGWPSLWWNNRLSEKLHGSGRLVNLQEYLILQIIVLSVRSLAVWALWNPYKPIIPIPQNAAHLFMLLFISMCIIRSLTVVKLRKNAVFSKSTLKPIVAEPSNVPTLANPTTPKAFNTNSENSFPFESLATPASLRSSTYDDTGYESTTTSITSAFDDDYGSEMEWTPTKETFSPRFPVIPSSQADEFNSSTGANPFRSTLPAAPEHPMHRISKPPLQPTFMRPSEEKRDQFWNQMMHPVGQDSAARGGNALMPADTGAEMNLAAGKLRLPQADTGLETMFHNFFSLSDEPKEVRGVLTADAQGSAKHPGTEAPWIGVAFWILAVVLPCGAATAWMLA